MNNIEFNDAFHKLQSTLFSFAIRLTQNQEDAKDLMQETAMLAYANLHRFEPGSYFKSWVSTIMRNSFINNYRKMKTRNKVCKPIENCLYAVENKAVTNQAESLIMQQELTAILETLSIEYKVPFVMFYQGHRYEEIAEHMQLPVGTVKSRIFYARKQLRSIICLHYKTNHLRPEITRVA